MIAGVAAVDAVRMRGISKYFGGIRALEGVDFDVRASSVHALLGGNGAGKSTILKILSGVHPPSAGKVEIFGTAMKEFTPKAARNAGVAMIFQEMSLIPTLTVAENIFLTREPRIGGIFLDDRIAVTRARELLATLGVTIDPRTPLERLSTGQKQMTEIAKAISQSARVLILDEPTSALSTAEVAHLFALLRHLRGSGVAIIYVSHRMDEIQEIADTITILRNGRHVVTKPSAELTIEEIIEHIVGRRVRAFDRVPRVVDRSREPLLELRRVSGRRWPIDVSLALYPGEVLGLAGLLGSGRSELARVLAGIDPVHAGDVLVRGTHIRRTSAGVMLATGIAMIPEDRRIEGLILEHSIFHNITLPTIDRLSHHGLVDDRKARSQARRLIEQLRVKAGPITAPARTLSGGNQQKIVLAKWLAAEPDILILDEPTAGIDIGSKAEIVELIRTLTEQGKGIIMVSSELAELLAVSDRILIMQSGRVVREIGREEIDGWSTAGGGGSQITDLEKGLELAIQEARSHE
ncbi:MAG: sugar ABC transporter ATP-binding protein [Acetobacteraceae bacterium]